MSSGRPEVRPIKMAAVYEKSRGWQTTKTLTECHQYMLDNQVACDITIVFNTSSGIKTQCAHKYVLMCRSPVFEAMFSGGFKETDKITIDDIELEVFLDILRFMYSGEASISGHNVLRMMYAAKKYLLDGLVQKCSQFLEDEITKENVCSILNYCLLYDEKTLTGKCITFIASHRKTVFESDDFLNLDKVALCYLLSTDVGYLTEPVDTFQYCMRWAKTQQGTNDDRESVRKILGKCLYQMPFTSMTPLELASILGDEPDLLNDKEQIMLFKYIARPGQREKAAVSVLGFTHIDMKAQIVLSKIRFAEVICNKSKMWTGSKNRPDSIDFQVSQDIKFHGVTLFGGENVGDTHSVCVELYDGSTRLCQYDSVIISDGTNMLIRVPITTPVDIKQGKLYTVKAGRDGPNTYYGIGGHDSVVTAGCTFSFCQSIGINNCTSVEKGQIPNILFIKL